MISLLLKESAATLHVWATKWDSDTGILEANFILAKSSLAFVSTGEDSCVHPRRFLPAFPAAHHLLIHLVRSILLICLVYPVLQLLTPFLGWYLPQNPRWLSDEEVLGHEEQENKKTSPLNSHILTLPYSGISESSDQPSADSEEGEGA